MKKNKRKVSNMMLVFICIMITAYAIANFVLQYYTQVEVSPALTTAWFSFWGVELISLTAIKTSKLKHKVNDTAENEDVQSSDCGEDMADDYDSDNYDNV